MTPSVTPTGYSRAQIAIHWLIAAMIIFQIAGHEGMAAAYEAIMAGRDPAGFDMILARMHVIAGIAIWFFALWRVYLRFTRGVPVPPESEHPLLKKLAGFVHFVLYALILLMPISGSVAWFFGLEAAANGHSLARFVLMPALLLHIGGALAHHFWFKTDVMRRMLKPQA